MPPKAQRLQKKLINAGGGKKWVFIIKQRFPRGEIHSQEGQAFGSCPRICVRCGLHDRTGNLPFKLCFKGKKRGN